MQVRAWLFGFLGFVFAVTAIGWYELRKPELPMTYSYNPVTDSLSDSLKPLDEFIAALPEWYDLERVRAFGLLLAGGCFFLAWRNSVGYTAAERHREIMAALEALHPAPSVPHYQKVGIRSRFDDPLSPQN